MECLIRMAAFEDGRFLRYVSSFIHVGYFGLFIWRDRSSAMLILCWSLIACLVSFFFPPPKGKNIFLANGCRVISPSRSSGQQARRDRQQHVQHTTTTSYIYMSWCCVVGFQQSPRLFERPRAIVQQHETHCCVVPSHMHRSNKVHSNIDRPIDFPPNSHRRRRSTTFFGFFFFWPGCDGVSVKVKKPPKSWFFLIFSDDNYFWLDGHSQSGHHTQLPALRCAADKLSSTQSSAIRKEKTKKCVCVFILFCENFFSKKFRVMMWRVRFHNTEHSVLSVP